MRAGEVVRPQGGGREEWVRRKIAHPVLVWSKVAGPQSQPWGYLIPEDLYIQVGAR